MDTTTELAEQYSTRAGFNGALRRINKELVNLTHEPLSNITAGPVGDDLVFNAFFPNLLCN
jgi:hypothetical protein